MKSKKILVAFDSFKGCMTSLEAGNAAKEALKTIHPDSSVVVKILADGGDGTLEALTTSLNGKLVNTTVRDPLGRIITAEYGITGDTAIIEMAKSSGIALLKENEKDPHKANTYGFGQMILDAYQKGCRKYILCIGGSATTEAGIGMLSAIGYAFYDKEGNEVLPYLDNLDKITKIDNTSLLVNPEDMQITIACDVTNPLCGKDGAVSIYGPQKGVKSDEIDILDKKLLSFAKLANEENINTPGSGAAGGLGYTILSFFKNSKLQSGAELVMDVQRIEEELKDTDILITGEGRFDSQTATGKGPMMVAKLAKGYDVYTYIFAGSIENGVLKSEYINEYHSITPNDMDLETAIKKDVAINNLKKSIIKNIK